MTTRKSQRHHLKLTPEQQITIDEVRRTIETKEKDEIMALAKRLRNAKRRGMATREKMPQVLKHEPESPGVSLAAMEERTGMATSNLSKMENNANSKPTVATLITFADASGKKQLITLDDK